MPSAAHATHDHPGYAPDYLSTLRTRELHEILRSSKGLPLTALLNRGTLEIDFDARRVWRDSFWKGSFARDTPMGVEERLVTPVRSTGPNYVGGRFWKRFDAIHDGVASGQTVNYGVSLLPGQPVVRACRYPDDRRPYLQSGDEVLLLNYLNWPYRGVYDVMKIVDENNCVGVMHLGRFPHGVQFATFVMSRNNHPFHKITVPDHDALFESDRVRVPAPAELAGSWKGYVVFHRHPERAMHNQFNPPLLRFRFDPASGAGTAARLGYGLIPSSRRVEFDEDAVRLTAGSSSYDEIRLIDRDTLIGRRVRRSPTGTTPGLRYVLTRRTG